MGFGIFLVINDGNAVLRQAGRVTEKYRGKGLSPIGIMAGKCNQHSHLILVLGNKKIQ